jgi:uncharacterized protein (TIGR02996 family)
MARKKDPPPTSSQDDQRASLFAGVKVEPDDDAPRLVLADWLEENGNTEDDRDHAELIRVQCEALHRAACLIDPERPGPIHGLLRNAGYHTDTLPYDFARLTGPDERIVALNERAEQLTRRWHEERRIAILPGGRLGSWYRGFADLYLRDVPFRSRDMATLAASPFGPRINQMALNVSASNAEQIGRSEMLAHLTGLYLTGQAFRGGALETILASPHLAGLRRLDLGLFARWDKVKAIITAPQHERFTHLYLYGHRLDTGGYRKLADADLSALKSLHLGGTPDMGAKGAKALAGAAFLGHLQELILTNNWVGTEGLEALAAGPHFRCPARLEVGGNQLGRAGLRVLLDAPGLEDVVFLELHQNELDDAALAMLAASPRLSGLLSLDLGGNPLIGPAGAEALAASPYLARLASLKLGGTIGEAGARALLGSPHLRRLQLDLHEENISTETLAALSKRYLLEKL